jgi:hypothetical protein
VVLDRALGEHLVRHDEAPAVVEPDVGVGEPDVLDLAGLLLDRDEVAEPDRLRDREHDPGDRVGERRAGRGQARLAARCAGSVEDAAAKRPTASPDPLVEAAAPQPSKRRSPADSSARLALIACANKGLSSGAELLQATSRITKVKKPTILFILTPPQAIIKAIFPAKSYAKT